MGDIPPLRLVFSGGGIRVVAHAGALQVLEKRGFLRTVKEYVGVSAGALIALCLVIGYTPDMMSQFCVSFDFSLIRSIEPEAVFEFMETLGFDTGEKLRSLVRSILRQRGLGPTTTFADLRRIYPQAPRLRIFASDIFTCTPREFNETETPQVDLITAVMASMCIPGYFVPVRDPITNHMLVDGGALQNFPLAFLTEEEQKTSLGLTFSEDHTRVDDIETPFALFQQIYACFYLPRTLELWKHNKRRIIIIPCGDFPMWDFEASSDVRRELIEKGAAAAREFTCKGTKPLRRYSVS
jgi:NTE family protein